MSIFVCDLSSQAELSWWNNAIHFQKRFIWYPKYLMERTSVSNNLKKVIILKEVGKPRNKNQRTSEDPTDFIFQSKFSPGKGVAFTQELIFVLLSVPVSTS